MLILGQGRLSTRSGHLLCAKADTESAGRGQGQSRVAASGRRSLRQRSVSDPQAQPAPAYELDSRIDW
jgi:hypothetical protein